MGISQYDIDQKTENYFKYTQKYEPALAEIIPKKVASYLKIT